MSLVLQLDLVEKDNASDPQNTINISRVPASEQPVMAENVTNVVMSSLEAPDVSMSHATALPVKSVTVMQDIQGRAKELRKTGNITTKANMKKMQVKPHNSCVEMSGNQAILKRNPLARVQVVPKPQVVMSAAQASQVTVNQATNTKQPRSPNPMNLKSPMNAFANEKALPQQPFCVTSVNPNQRVQPQGNQQSLQKAYGISQKSLGIHRHQTAPSKKVMKSHISNQQKFDVSVQQQCQNKVQLVQKPAQARNDEAAASSMADSVIGIPNTPKDTTIINNLKQVCSLHHQAPQQPPQFHQNLTKSVAALQQTQCAIVSHLQRNQITTNVQQCVMTAEPASNNQRVQITPKLQSQQPSSTVVRMGQQKKQTQTAPTGGAKLTAISKNSVKTLSQKNTAPKTLSRNPNCQAVKIIQQEKNMFISHNTCKQLGCVKTIPAQRLTAKHQAVKMSGIKTSLNTNMNAMKELTAAAITSVGQKNSKCLQPQQPGGSHLTPYKNQSGKNKEHGVLQKQLLLGPQQAQHMRTHPSQVKSAVPVNISDPRIKSKLEIDSLSLKEDKSQQMTQPSPQPIMPHPFECLQSVLQDHNYGAPPPRTPPPQTSPVQHKQPPVNGAGSTTGTYQHPFVLGQGTSSANIEDDAGSAISSDAGGDAELEGEETETAAEGEGDDEDSITRCICDFQHDDGYMICCDRCLVWQHVDCMGIDRSNIPDEYLCEVCRPRRVDKIRARTLQMRKREELLNSEVSSDTSSTSSADTDVGVNVNAKKRPLPSIPKRKCDAPQVRRLVNNNNNVAKRQRRDMQSRQSSVARKKELAKRVQSKKKSKRRIGADEKEEETSDAWGSNMAPLRQWIERYEEAVTNHYSPELRARISSIKVNGTHNDLRQSNISAAATGKCRLNTISNNLPCLVAATNLPPNTPILELRGKYMLSTQHRPSHPQGSRQYSQRPGPFVFFYQLPRDGTEVCVDARTYGNDARFIRRSCKPNAEVKHCIEKGTLHLYIVTNTAIEKNAEITIRHEQHDLMLSPNSNSFFVPLVCACNNPKKCQVASLSQTNKKGSNGAFAENTDGRERRRRGRRNTVTEENVPTNPPTCTKTSQPSPTIPTTTTKSVPVAVTTPQKKIVSQSSSSSSSGSSANTVRPVVKEEPQPAPQTPVSPALPESPKQESKKDKSKMTREERKMEAIMKAFERLEKAEQRKQEVQARNAQRKESGGALSDLEDGGNYNQSKSKQHCSDKPLVRRKRRKGRARTTSTSQSQSSRRAQVNSPESDLSSGDETIGMISPPLSAQSYSTHRDLAYSIRVDQASKDISENSNLNSNATGNTGIPSAAGILLALSQSNVSGPSSPSMQSANVKSPTCDSGASSSSQSSTPSTPLSSACLLVAAAVGPLAPGFKFPKTKKVLMNEWLKESPDPVTQMAEMPSALQTSTNVETSSTHELDAQRPDLTSNKNIATLVQAATSIKPMSEYPQQPRQMAISNVVNSMSSGSAKKRWLRQAISEECESPNSRPESPPSEMVAPPKKRRIARESLSSDNYTPPTTPTLMLPDTLPSHVALNNEDDFSEHLSSSPLHEQEVQHDYEQEPIKTELKLKSEDLDEFERLQSSSLATMCVKTEVKDEIISDKEVKVEGCTDSSYADDYVKTEPVEIKREADLPGSSNAAKVEPKSTNLDSPQREKSSPASKPLSNVKEEDVVEKGTVEIIDQNEQDAEMDDLSSPFGVMESDAVLKQRVAEMRLEFGGGVAEIVNISGETEKPDEASEEREGNDEAEETMSIDEFDVEAQMKKITGDDGNDYKEKMFSSSERDKNVDGIEGLMESSKEDSESEDRELDEISDCDDDFADFDESLEEADSKVKRDIPDSASDKFDADKEDRVTAEIEQATESEKVEQLEQSDKIAKESTSSPKNDAVDKEVSSCSLESNAETATSKAPDDGSAIYEESIKALTSADGEELLDDPSKVFPSIPPLSERIRKKTEQTTAPKLQLHYVAAVIESSINTEMEDGDNLKEKSILSTAFRELLEAKLDDDDDDSTDIVNKSDKDTVVESSVQPEKKAFADDVVQTSKTTTKCAAATTVEEEAPPVENKRKDPRTAIPNKPLPSSSKMQPTPVKRKLSISEYRKRKQQSPCTLPEMEASADSSLTEKAGTRRRSDSASSGTSSMSSDEETLKLPINSPSLHALQLFSNPDIEEKKGNEEGVIGWSAAPTLVERQRENLTERLKREFGLFLSDDEEERARKQGLTTEAILKSRKMSPSHVLTADGSMAYPLTQTAQLPPQPYIPPPGSASIHYSQFSNNSPTSQYKKLVGAQPPQPVPYPSMLPQSSTTNDTNQQFLVPQAPPGSNPYPPQFVAPAPTNLANLPRYPVPPPPPPSPSLPVPATVGVSTVASPNPTQKSYSTHPPSRS